ncbi:MAG TPA: preprotein translocase subunit YajC [Acidimicrobiales bacterium]|nr:preprotein translocase subunit YajC [Acidimicrobiales bacterium]
MTMQPAAFAVLLAASSSSSAKPSAAGTLASLLPLVLIGVLAWLLFFRPRAQQAKRQREEMMTLDVGDEILTGAGIFGTIVEIDGDRVVLETAPGSRVTVLRSTIARRLTEPPPVEEEHDEWDVHDGDDWGDEGSHGSPPASGNGHGGVTPEDNGRGGDGAHSGESG